MNENREQLRLGIPITPPVPQTKVEELMGKIIVKEVPRYFKEITAMRKADTDTIILPSTYTIVQLLKSFSGYNSWMATAAREGDIGTLTKNVEDAGSNIEKAKWMMKRGRRYAFEKRFDLACKDFLEAKEYVEKEENGEDAYGEEYPRLLEWVAMCHHLRYNLDEASKCYEKCSDFEPENVSYFIEMCSLFSFCQIIIH